MPLLVPMLGRNDEINRLAESLGRRETEYSFCARIPRDDRAVRVHADDGILGCIADALKPGLWRDVCRAHAFLQRLGIARTADRVVGDSRRAQPWLPNVALRS
jgi:hypothetical protein